MQVQLQQITLQRPNDKPAVAPILSQISLAINAGEQIAIIGPSGAGKTSLLQVLACASKAQSGILRLFGAEPWLLSNRDRHQLRRQLFIAPQTPPLPPRQRVVTAVSAALLTRWNVWQSLRNLFSPIAANQVWQALQKFDLQDKLYERVDHLSGGERQRCALARLLLTEAQLLLVDEPLSALDPTLAQQTLSVLREEARRRGASLICSLHQVDLALAHFPRIIALRDGKIVFDAAPSEITPVMIAELYQNERRIEVNSVPVSYYPEACV